MAQSYLVAQDSSDLRDAFSGQRVVFGALLLTAILVVLAGSYAIGATKYGIFVVVGLMAVVAGPIMVVRPEMAMYILVFSIYTNASDVVEVAFGIPSTNKLLVALTFVAVIGTRAIIQKKPLVFGALDFSVMIYAAVAVVTLFASGKIGIAFDNLIDYIKDIAIIIILVQLVENELHFKRMIWVIIIGAFFLSSLTTIQVVTGDYDNEFFGFAKAPVHQVFEDLDNNRPVGPLDDPNYYSQILLLVLPFAIYRGLTDPNPMLRTIGLGISATIMIAVVGTYSRAALVAMAGVLGLIVLERRMNIILVGGIVTILIGSIIPFLPKGYMERISTLGSVFNQSETRNEASFTGRTSEAVVAIQMFLEHPILGIGYSSYEESYQEYSERLGLDSRVEARSAHSLYLEVMSETGLIGILSFGGMLATFYLVTQNGVAGLRAVGREDMIPWVRGVQFGFMSYLITSIFLHDDWVRYFRFGLALMASTSIAAQTVIAKEKAKSLANGVAKAFK